MYPIKLVIPINVPQCQRLIHSMVTTKRNHLVDFHTDLFDELNLNKLADCLP